MPRCSRRHGPRYVNSRHTQIEGLPGFGGPVVGDPKHASGRGAFWAGERPFGLECAWVAGRRFSQAMAPPALDLPAGPELSCQSGSGAGPARAGLGGGQAGSPSRRRRQGRGDRPDCHQGAGAGWRRHTPSRSTVEEPQRGSYLHTAPETLFEELGFERDRQIAKWRWAIRRRVRP